MLELDAQPLALGTQLTCRARGLQPRSAVDGIGVQLTRADKPARILVDGYQSWDWAGVRDARLGGRGWWAAVWGDARAGPAAPVAIRLAEPPNRALSISWSGDGSLDVVSCGEPEQTDNRTDTSHQIAVPSNGMLASDRLLLSAIDAHGTTGVGLPPGSGAAFPGHPLRGWMSWNCLGSRVCAADVLEVARELVPPGGLALLDDGWMPHWGDWVERPDFGATLVELARMLRQDGQALGAWVAPFLVHPESRLAVGHPELLLRDAGGESVIDHRPTLPQLVLDGASPAVAAHLRQVGKRIGGAGVSTLKVDFLYAGALPGAHEGGVSGTVALRTGLEALVTGFREFAPQPAAVLACGAPLPPISELVDTCRSGGDAVINVPNSGAAPPPRPWFAHGRTVVRAQSRNLAARSWLWGGTVPPDVDAVTFGAVGDMPPVEEDGLDTWLELVHRSGGPFLVSDLPAGLSEKRRNRLRAELAGPDQIPMRPRDPLQMAPSPMSEDMFYAWPEELADDWHPAGERTPD
jgi:alpha-galactosidase